MANTFVWKGVPFNLPDRIEVKKGEQDCHEIIINDNEYVITDENLFDVLCIVENHVTPNF